MANTTITIRVSSLRIVRSDVDGQSVTSYQGSFTPAVDTTTIAPAVVSTNPANLSSGVPSNLVIDLGFNEVLDPTTVNGTKVTLFANACSQRSACGEHREPSGEWNNRLL